MSCSESVVTRSRAAHVLDDDRAVGVDLVFLGLHRILVHVDVVDLTWLDPYL